MKFICIARIICIICLQGTTSIIHAAPSNASLESEPPLTVELEASRAQLVAGEGLGITARLKNTSKKPIYITEQSFSITVPIEMEGKRAGVSGIYAYFPTEFHRTKLQGTETVVPAEEFYKGKIKLESGDTYSVFWTNTWGDNPSALSAYILDQITTQFQFLFFYPGKYSITLNGKYWLDPTLPQETYRVLSKSITLPVTAPLFVILLGSAIGGLVAYTLLPQTVFTFPPETKYLDRVLRRAGGIFGSMLLSIIVTIVLSRVSDSHFLISITVNDVWGAIVTGFIANYAGYKVIKQLLPTEEKK